MSIPLPASEILAGAIQDNDRGIIIGRRSFGRACTEQRQFSDKVCCKAYCGKVLHADRQKYTKTIYQAILMYITVNL
jgi:C-terminal processing protease CtpA/Prc